jgi:hypothetical protein
MAQLKLGTYLLCLKCLQWFRGENFETRIKWVDILSWTFNDLNLHKWTKKGDYCSFKHHIFCMFISNSQNLKSKKIAKTSIIYYIYFMFYNSQWKILYPKVFPLN